MALPPLDTKTARRIAVLADADDRSVQKVARGESVRGHVHLRIRRALEAEGLIPTAQAQSSASK